MDSDKRPDDPCDGVETKDLLGWTRPEKNSKK